MVKVNHYLTTFWVVKKQLRALYNRPQRAFFPTAQATMPTNNRRCSVSLHKSFASHRPETAKTPESPFFLAANNRRSLNSIGKFLVDAAKAAGLPGNISNHSVRKTCISRLMDAEIPVNYVAQLSGHKNLKSVDAYKAASTVHQRKMSNVLSRTTATSTRSHETSLAQNQPSSSISFSSQESAITRASRLFSGAKLRSSKAAHSTLTSFLPTMSRVPARKDDLF